ncbi:MAG TPA: T9SS type A sorting domain-containing protein [Ignavibacteriaceae bacterium]|nr:T9SS type A sorting domain-containing protein [Ignavibacteriaceae bacterium]
MKNIAKLFLVLTFISTQALFSQTLFTENFDYAPSSLLTANGWTAHSGAGTNSVAVVEPGLTYPLYELSGIGNSARFVTTGEDVSKQFDSVTTGSVYAFMMAKFDSATTTQDYFFHLGPRTMGTTFRGRLFVRANAEGALSFGVSLGSTSPTVINWTPYSYAKDVTYLLVMKYQFVEGASNDIVSLFVNPALNGIEPTADVVHTDAAIADAAGIGSVAIRQGSSSARYYGWIDGIQIRTDWPAVVPVEFTSFSAVGFENGVRLSWSTATETNNNGFNVERKSVSGNWENIGFVKGNGTTASKSNYTYTDQNLNGSKYSYRLKQLDFDGSYSYSKVVEIDLNKSLTYSLNQNYPNPFNPSTTVSFSIAKAGNVKLSLYNLLGQEVKSIINGFISAGNHTVNIDASNLNTGVYLYKIESGSFSQVRKMTLMK